MSEADEALEWAEYAEEDLIMAKCALAIQAINPLAKKRRMRSKLQ